MIGFIGGGKMAEALIKGIVGQDSVSLYVSERLEERRRYLESSYKIKTTASNKDVAVACDTIILAVKPQDMTALLDEIADYIKEDKIVVSIVAGLTLAFFQQKLKTKKLVRVMPNIPVIVQEGMSALSFEEHVCQQDIALVQQLFTSVGKVIIIPEKQMNAISALSGSGPAFIAFFVEALNEVGVQMGLDKQQVAVAVLQTLVGTAKLLSDGMTPEQLRFMVTSPGGMTAAGIKTFEDEGLKKMVALALCNAQKRGEELGNK